jgi:D-arabinose 1-dehydrogenase-like Zn-dependent alcohol dehydrogenase
VFITQTTPLLVESERPRRYLNSVLITISIKLSYIQKVNEAYEGVLNSDVQYRFVIDINSLNKNSGG